MSRYRALLFDLDHTLWDYETNSAETLTEIYHRHQLQNLGAGTLREFLETFTRVNNELWKQYDSGAIGREVIRFERFHHILKSIDIDNYELSLQLSNEYVAESPRKSHLLPGARKVLDYLYDKYPMVIVTNGFDEIQGTKLQSSGIEKYFKSVVTSERAGYKKPAPEIFAFAMNAAGASHEETVMIGDNLLTDIGGARQARIDTIFFNPGRQPYEHEATHEIHALEQLMTML
ncbi:MAG: YjjG family noncanonical pyrimidine nucleotidase [Cyclobacteriaceae bacterium]|nr:YjjG family noncanonical pyrimidine nucleotidase [Cyclobacteriaceae bacterium]